jgi:hypothetical protein
MDWARLLYCTELAIPVLFLLAWIGVVAQIKRQDRDNGPSAVNCTHDDLRAVNCTRRTVTQVHSVLKGAHIGGHDVAMVHAKSRHSLKPKRSEAI